jgi:malate dehydrogenase
VAERLGVPVGSVRTLTLGSHGDTMVPVPSACSVDGKPLADLLPADEIDQLVTRTRGGGGEIVALLKTGSAYYAPSSAAAWMARAVATDSGAVLPVCAWVDGQYGIDGVYLGVEAAIGVTGIREVVERDLSDTELAALREAAEGGPAKAGRRSQPVVSNGGPWLSRGQPRSPARRTPLRRRPAPRRRTPPPGSG